MRRSAWSLLAICLLTAEAHAEPRDPAAAQGPVDDAMALMESRDYAQTCPKLGGGERPGQTSFGRRDRGVGGADKGARAPAFGRGVCTRRRAARSSAVRAWSRRRREAAAGSARAKSRAA